MVKRVSSGQRRILCFTLDSDDLREWNVDAEYAQARGDFGFGLMPGSTCPVLGGAILAAGDSCYAVVRFSPTEFFAGWLAQGSLIATATDPNTGQVLVELSIPVSGMGTL